MHLVDLETEASTSSDTSKRVVKRNPRYIESEEEDSPAPAPNEEMVEKPKAAKRKVCACVHACPALIVAFHSIVALIFNIMLCVQAASEMQSQQDNAMWEKKKIRQFQIMIQELRDTNMSLKKENEHLKDLVIKRKYIFIAIM